MKEEGGEGGGGIEGGGGGEEGREEGWPSLPPSPLTAYAIQTQERASRCGHHGSPQDQTSRS